MMNGAYIDNPYWSTLYLSSLGILSNVLCEFYQLEAEMCISPSRV